MKLIFSLAVMMASTEAIVLWQKSEVNGITYPKGIDVPEEDDPFVEVPK